MGGWQWLEMVRAWCVVDDDGAKKKKNVPSFVSTGTVSFWGGATQMPVVLKRKNSHTQSSVFHGCVELAERRLSLQNELQQGEELARPSSGGRLLLWVCLR
jgi:hypothetical protein